MPKNFTKFAPIAALAWPPQPCLMSKGCSNGVWAPFLTRVGSLEAQGDTVVAIALASGPGPVVEDMSLMAAAAPAMVFRARNDQPEILACHHCVRQGLPEAGPPRVTVEFGCGAKERQLAAGTEILTGPLLLVQGTAEGSLGAMLPQDVESGRAEPVFPNRFTELPLGGGA